MSFSVERKELAEFLQTCVSSIVESDKIVKTMESEGGITSAQGYSVYVRVFELEEFVLLIDAWTKDGPTYVHMKLALDAAMKIHQKR